MAKKNGHDDGSEPEDSNVTRFPDPQAVRRKDVRFRIANDSRAPAEPILNMPPLVKTLCLALILIQAVMSVIPDDMAGAAYDNLGFIVTRYTGESPFGWQGLVTPLTHMFLHGGWLHLAINVATLAAFGTGLEKHVGPKKLAALFFATGLLGAFTHAAIYFLYGATGNALSFPHPEAPLVGASGGISGLFGAVLMMAQERGLMGGYRALLPFIAVWILISVFFGFFGMPGAEGPIAWTTHIGGFVAGLLLYRPVARARF